MSNMGRETVKKTGQKKEGNFGKNRNVRKNEL